MHNIKKFTVSMQRNLNIRATQNKSNQTQMNLNKSVQHTKTLSQGLHKVQ